MTVTLYIGGSVIDALFADGAFKPRAITRNVSSDAALKLKLRGVEVVQGNLNLEDTDPLAAAVAGSECVFAVSLRSILSVRIAFTIILSYRSLILSMWVPRTKERLPKVNE
jgi:uncharacterized protein YbjT (DUF2867 family)